MRALGIALAVLAVSLTSGGVAYRSSVDLSSEGHANQQAGQCLVEKPTLAVLELPKLTERRIAVVRPLSGSGFNYLSEDRWHPERGTAAPSPAAAPSPTAAPLPAAPRR
jgi:hypothetical protein